MHDNMFKEVKLYLGVPIGTSLKECMVASLTSLLSTLTIIYLSQGLLTSIYGDENLSYNTFILTSIAATSVLVFAVPHGALSQPWPVIGGHFFSALVGVLCWKYAGSNLFIASALAVSLSILIMSFFRCIHPPGGATALGAVLGGESVHALGFSYILTPTLLNCVIIIITATLINYPLAWRRYPAHLYFKLRSFKSISPGEQENEITFEDFLKAIKEHDSYIDITPDGWNEIFENAQRHAELDNKHPSQLEKGLSYSNGKLGNLWGVRYITHIDTRNNIEFTIVAGKHTGLLGRCTKEEFIKWAKFVVYLDTDNIWVKAHRDDS